MIKVIVGEKESIDRAITRFKKKCQQSGILRDYRKNSYFLKPSQKRRLKREKAIRRLKKIIEN